MAAKKRKPKPPDDGFDPVTVFRWWLAGRLLGEIEPDRPSASDARGFDLPRLAWGAFSALAAKGASAVKDELTRAFRILFDDLDRLAWTFTKVGPESVVPSSRQSAHFLAAIDEFLPWVMMRLSMLRELRAQVSDSADLLCSAACDAVGTPLRAEFLMRRYYRLDPEEKEMEAGGEGLPASMMESACEAVELLEELQEEYPKAAAWVARYRNRWPVMQRSGEKQSPAFRKLAVRIRLGEDYPLNPRSKLHRSRTGSLPNFVIPVIEWLIPVCAHVAEMPESERLSDAREFLRRRGHPWGLQVRVDPAGAAEILVKAAELPPLRKATVGRWARDVLAPFIMVSLVGDPSKTSIPALKAIWNRRGVKSREGFQGRLAEALARRLPSLVRN